MTGNRPLILVLVAALTPVVVLLALVPFHMATTFSGSGRADGYCPAPLESIIRRSGDGTGLWTATAPGERLYYLPRGSQKPVNPPGGATVAPPQAPCHNQARLRIMGAALFLVVLSMLPGLGERRSRSAMMPTMKVAAT